MSEQINITERAGWDESVEGKKWEDYEKIIAPNGETIDMVNLIEEMYRSIAALTHLAPMFGGFVSKLKIIYTFRVRTMATDGLRLFINPQFADKQLDFTGKFFVLAHEVMHCMLNHMRRAKLAGHTNHMRSNIAADYEVNASLVDIGLFKETTVQKLKGLYDKKYVGWGYEKIYDEVKNSNGQSMDNGNESKDAAKNQSNSSQSGSGSGSGSGQNKQYSADYKAGWAQAIADYKAGKLKI